MGARRRRVALLDWDNTLHDGWTLTPWVRFLVERGMVSAGAAADGQRLTHQYLEGRLGGSDDLAHLVNTWYAAAAAGLRATDVAALVGPFLDEVDPPLVYPFVPALLAWFVEHEIQPVVVTGAPAELVAGYVEPVGGRVEGLTLAVADGRYTGALARNPGTGDEKARVVAALLEEGCDVVLGAGDSESDLPLLRAADFQLVVGNPSLARELAQTSLLVEPRSTTGEALRRSLDALLGDALR